MLSVSLQMEIDPDPGGDPGMELVTIIAFFGTLGKVSPHVVMSRVMSTEETDRLRAKLGMRKRKPKV